MSTGGQAQDGALAVLPIEVLHNIFNRLRPFELLSLSRISERTQKVSLAVYFEDRGVDVSPTGIIDMTREEDTDLLAILRITTFFLRTGHISIVFVFPKWDFLENIMHLTLILKRLISVDMITLTFKFDPKKKIEEEKRHGIATPEARASRYKSLTKELQTLFTAAFRVANVVRILESEQLLNMVGGDLEDITLFRSCFGINKPVISRYKVAAKIRMNKFTKLATRKHNKQADFPSDTSVVILDIRSLIPLVPPFLSWTVICLNFQPQLTHLSFTLSPSDNLHWDPLLSNLHIPSLSQLTMSSRSCKLSDLAKFLKRHVCLTTLDIRDFAPMPAELPKVANLAFRFLVSLTAPCEVLGGFLAYPSDLLPNLREIHVAITIDKDQELDEALMHRTLIPFIARLQEAAVFGLVVLYQAGDSPFTKIWEKEAQSTLIPLFSSLNLRLRTELENNFVEQLPGWIRMFANIRELKVGSIYPYRYPARTEYSKTAITLEKKRLDIKDQLGKDLMTKLVGMPQLHSLEFWGETLFLASSVAENSETSRVDVSCIDEINDKPKGFLIP